MHARKIKNIVLKRIDGFKAAGDLRPEARKAKITEYFRLAPKDFNRKTPPAAELLAMFAQLRKEADILDALESALSNVQTSVGADRVFNCRLTKAPDRRGPRRVRHLFERIKCKL